MMLKRAGFGTVDLVEDGQAAVDYCKALSDQDQPRIIFMDNTMPRMVSKVCFHVCSVIVCRGDGALGVLFLIFQVTHFDFYVLS